MNPPGFTFLPGTDRHGHLYFVLSTPSPFSQVAIANFTTARRLGDWTCVVEPGEHPWVRHRTLVAYDRARLVDVAAFEKRIATGIYLPYPEPLTPGLLERIQQGALASAHTVARVKEAVRWMIEEGSA